MVHTWSEDLWCIPNDRDRSPVHRITDKMHLLEASRILSSLPNRHQIPGGHDDRDHCTQVSHIGQGTWPLTFWSPAYEAFYEPKCEHQKSGYDKRHELAHHPGLIGPTVGSRQAQHRDWNEEQHERERRTRPSLHRVAYSERQTEGAQHQRCFDDVPTDPAQPVGPVACSAIDLDRLTRRLVDADARIDLVAVSVVVALQPFDIGLVGAMGVCQRRPDGVTEHQRHQHEREGKPRQAILGARRHAAPRRNSTPRHANEQRAARPEQPDDEQHHDSI